MKKRAPGQIASSTGIRRRLTSFRGIWAIAIVAVTSAPYLFNWLTAPAGYHYTWIIPPYPEDLFGYFGWAEQAVHGAWLFKIKFTALPHAPFLFHPFFLMCGWLGALFSCELGIIFWVVKAIGVGLFFLVLYRYLDFLGLTRRQSAAAAVLVGISSGAGGILMACGSKAHWAVKSADLWMPELNTFWSLLWNPLFPFSLTLMLCSIFWLDRGSRQSQTSDLWRSGFAAGVMALLHPYSVPLLFALSVIIVVARRKRESVRYLWRYFASALPFVIYVAALSRFDPILQRHSAAGAMMSPPVVEYLLGFGLPLILLALGLTVFRKHVLGKYWHLVAWFFLAFALAYFPFWFQRKLIFGAHIPLCIIGGIVFDAILSRWLDGERKWIGIAVTIVLVPILAATPAVLLLTEAAQVRGNDDGTYYISNEVIEGLNVLRDTSRPDQIVLATPVTSRIIPGYCGNTVVWGHWAMSVDYWERVDTLGKILNAQADVSDESTARALWGENIQFLFADGGLKESMESRPFFWGLILKRAHKIFENGAVVIYERPETL